MYKTILITWLTNWDDNWIVQETEININVFSLNISGRLMTVVKFSVLTGNKYCIRVSHNWLQLPTSTLHRSPVMPYPHRPRWQTRCRGTVWYHRECWCRWLLACKMARKTCVPCVISASESHFLLNWFLLSVSIVTCHIDRGYIFPSVCHVLVLCLSECTHD